MKIDRRNFLTVFLSAGIPAGLGIGFLEFWLFFDVIRGLLFGIAALVIIGSLLSLLGSRFTRFPRANRKMNVLQFLSLSIGGLLLGLLFAVFANNAFHGKWVEIQAPPEEITSFLPSKNPSLMADNLYVQAKSGKTYAYNCVTEEKCEWIQQEFTTSDDQDSACSFDSDLFKAPKLPGNPVDSIESKFCGADYVVLMKFILTDDGQIFYWEIDRSANNVVSHIFGFSFFGFLSGIAASIAVNSRRKKTGSQSSSAAAKS